MKLLIFPIIAALLSLVAGLLVMLAYGIGWILNLFLEFTPFEATALSLAGLFMVLFTLVSTFKGVSQFPIPLPDYAEEDDWEEEEEEEVVVKAPPPRPGSRRKR